MKFYTRKAEKVTGEIGEVRKVEIVDFPTEFVIVVEVEGKNYKVMLKGDAKRRQFKESYLKCGMQASFILTKHYFLGFLGCKTVQDETFEVEVSDGNEEVRNGEGEMVFKKRLEKAMEEERNVYLLGREIISEQPLKIFKLLEDFAVLKIEYEASEGGTMGPYTDYYEVAMSNIVLIRRD